MKLEQNYVYMKNFLDHGIGVRVRRDHRLVLNGRKSEGHAAVTAENRGVLLGLSRVIIVLPM